ncbi:hypothetical protein GCM10007901_15480 [Dyella acidisoli]|uniref:Uncharacterized protein n=1 Tax=Dyella acidisoli TaxID=1867834 RepID=A0ABQ5XNN0_9GAMM|nr:hypothetical protein GCM10007901_15480 [Dyella acidisoli]
MTVLEPDVFWNQIAAALSARIVPLLMMVLPEPSGFTASALNSVPDESTVAPCSTVNVLLLRKSIVLAPVLYPPLPFTASFCTSAPDWIRIFALSESEIAVASPNTTCAFVPTVTVAPEAVVGPEPIVVVHGEGEFVSHVVTLLAVMQFALT